MRSSGHMDVPDPMSTVVGLEAFSGRGAGRDAERRAAGWLANRCSAAGWEVILETFWCRPDWALAALWHFGLGIAGSLISLASPIAGIAVLAVALISTLSDALAGRSLGRWLSPERASQNVIASPRPEPRGADPAMAHATSTEDGSAPRARPTRLVLTANYDAGRTGLAYRIRPLSACSVRALRGASPGWLGWTLLALAWLLVVAILRQAGDTSETVGAVQFPPTIGLLLGFALLVELATGNWSPGAGDNATGVAAALEVAGALAAAPPRHLAIEVVLTGAGDGEPLGLRSYLRGRRRDQTDGFGRQPRRGSGAQTIVLAFAACAAGIPRWWQSDGSFLPLRYSRSLSRIAEQVQRDEPHLGVRAHRGRANSGAFAARAVGLPALTIGCLDERETPPRSHSQADTSAALDRQAIEPAVQLALLLVDGIDAAVGAARAPQAPTPA